jgi:hypothetical protein
VAYDLLVHGAILHPQRDVASATQFRMYSQTAAQHHPHLGYAYDTYCMHDVLHATINAIIILFAGINNECVSCVVLYSG